MVNAFGHPGATFGSRLFVILFFWCVSFAPMSIVLNLAAFELETLTWKKVSVMLTRHCIPSILMSVVLVESTGHTWERHMSYVATMGYLCFLSAPSWGMLHYYLGDDRVYEWRNLCCRCGPPRRGRNNSQAAGEKPRCCSRLRDSLGFLRVRAYLQGCVLFAITTLTFNNVIGRYWMYDYLVLKDDPQLQKYRAFLFGLVKCFTFKSLHHTVEWFGIPSFRLHSQQILLGWCGMVFPMMMAQCKTPTDVAMFLVQDWVAFLLRVFACVPFFHQYKIIRYELAC